MAKRDKSQGIYFSLPGTKKYYLTQEPYETKKQDLEESTDRVVELLENAISMIQNEGYSTILVVEELIHRLKKIK